MKKRLACPETERHFGCSSNDCLSEERTGSFLRSQDRVRVLLIVCVRLECSKLGHPLSQH